MDEHIRHRFVRRVIRLAYYRRILVALGLGLSVFAWVAWADAVTCRVVYNPATRTFIRICQ